jgi:hypothetical protein
MSHPLQQSLPKKSFTHLFLNEFGQRMINANVYDVIDELTDNKFKAFIHDHTKELPTNLTMYDLLVIHKKHKVTKIVVLN